jgi:hypothetical protein
MGGSPSCACGTKFDVGCVVQFAIYKFQKL